MPKVHLIPPSYKTLCISQDLTLSQQCCWGYMPSRMWHCVRWVASGFSNKKPVPSTSRVQRSQKLFCLTFEAEGNTCLLYAGNHSHNDTHILENLNLLHIHDKEQLVKIALANNHCLRIIWNPQPYCMGRMQNYSRDMVNMTTTGLYK